MAAKLSQHHLFFLNICSSFYGLQRLTTAYGFWLKMYWRLLKAFCWTWFHKFRWLFCLILNHHQFSSIGAELSLLANSENDDRISKFIRYQVTLLQNSEPDIRKEHQKNQIRSHDKTTIFLQYRGNLTQNFASKLKKLCQVLVVFLALKLRSCLPTLKSSEIPRGIWDKI